MTMLGLMDNSWAQKLLVAIVCNDGEGLLKVVSQISLQNPNYARVLDDLLALTHLILMTQLVPSAANLDDANEEFITELALQSSAEQIQVYYQLLLNGKKDLLWAPEVRLGFEMVLLRLLAFEPSTQIISAPSSKDSSNVKSSQSNKMANLRKILEKPKATEITPKSIPPIAKNHLSDTSTIKQEEKQNLVSETNIDINTQRQVENTVQVMSSEHAVNNTLEQQNRYQDSNDNVTEADINAQIQDVLNEAQILQSTHVADEQINQYSCTQQNTTTEAPLLPSGNKESNNESAQESVNVSKMMSGAQSAIARILANRNISGAGQLSAPSNSDIEQVALVKNEPVIKKTEPQRGKINIGKKDELKPNVLINNQKIYERIKSDPANLAPELLVQISGETD